MNLSGKTRTRLVALNVALWLLAGIAALSALEGPDGLVETTWKPVQRDLGGWAGLALGAAGITEPAIDRYALHIEPRVFRAAELLGREAGPVPAPESERWWFPARFGADGALYDVDLRLAGTAGTDRPPSERAWRVRFRGGSGYRGLRELELLPAPGQAHRMDLILREDARALGLVAPPAGFASLEINGSPAGTFFWSEGASTAMLERLGFPDGELLGPAAGPGPGRVQHAAGLAAHPDPDREVPPGVAALERLHQLVRSADDPGFVREVPEILDVEKFLAWNALLCIYGGAEAHALPEPDWYFDPVTGRLEPVVRSARNRAPLPRALALDATPTTRLADRLLGIPAFRARRNALLWSRIGGSGEDLAAAIDARLGDLLIRLARADGSLLPLEPLRDAARFRRAVRTELRDRTATLGAALAATQVETVPRLQRAEGAPLLRLEVKPAGLASLAVSELRFELDRAVAVGREPASIALRAPSGSLVRTVSAEPVVAGGSVSLRPRDVRIAPPAGGDDGGPPWTLELRLPFLDPSVWSRPGRIEAIEVIYRNEVTGVALPPAELVDRDPAAERPGDGRDPRFRPVEAFVAASGLPFEIRGDELVLPPGRYRLDETLVVPRAFRLRIEPGTEIELGPEVSILAFRGVTALGTPEAPILLQAADAREPWGSLGVARAPEPSELRWVTVSGGSRARFGGIEFDGQLAFNASEVSISDCEIQDARGADGMSVKRASFQVSRTRFIGNDSDGLESEWSKGRVLDSLFANNGDDGLDLTDSEVEVERSAFHWMGDKSVSAGARSRVAIDSTRLADSEVAVASKEDSRVHVRDTEFRRNGLGFAAYRDKPIFGGGSGFVSGGLFSRNDRDFSVEPGSHLELDHVRREEATAGEAPIGAVALRSAITRSR